MELPASVLFGETLRLEMRLELVFVTGRFKILAKLSML